MKPNQPNRRSAVSGKYHCTADLGRAYQDTGTRSQLVCLPICLLHHAQRACLYLLAPIAWFELWIQCQFFLNGPTPASFSFIFGLFKQTLLQFFQQINVKYVHPVYGAGNRAHDLWNMSLFP